MVKSGISVIETEKGFQLSLDGELYRKIARDWKQGKIKPFYTRLKEFIKALELDYGYPDS
ncbi:MAG: hypothetical protein ACFFE8_07450 [Candidatus Heimdallarchaeota archaeon]